MFLTRDILGVGIVGKLFYAGRIWWIALGWRQISRAID